MTVGVAVVAKALCAALKLPGLCAAASLTRVERQAMRLQDKVAIITGAGRGIGQATAIKFATEGAKVVICDLTPEWIEDTIYLCKETRGETMGYVADVRDIKALEAMVAATVAKWGRVDCLVNN